MYSVVIHSSHVSVDGSMRKLRWFYKNHLYLKYKVLLSSTYKYYILYTAKLENGTLHLSRDQHGMCLLKAALVRFPGDV